MLERTNFVRDVNKNYDVSIPSELKPFFERGDHYRVYHDADTGAIAYVPNNCSIESKFLRNLSPTGNEPKRKKYLLRYGYDNEAHLSLTIEQVNLFNWLRVHQYLDTDFELLPFDENIDWLDV